MKRKLFILVFMSVVLATASAWSETITLCSYGGTYNKGLEEIMAKPFTEATGIEVILTTVPRYAKMKAQVQTGNIEWDVVEVQNRMYARGVHDGFFEPLDLSMIKTEDFIEGSVLKYGVGLIYHSQNITYNTNKWPAGKGPKTMKDFFDVKKFPGPRAMMYRVMSTFEAALMADGVPRDKLYPLDVDRALKKLEQLKPHIRIFWKRSGQFQQIMREGEVDIGLGPGGRIMQLADEGVPLTWEWGDNIRQLDYWSILKGSKKKEAAMKFIAFMADPKRQAAFAEWTNYGPANKKAYAYIRKEKAIRMPTYEENYRKGILIDGDWYVKHGEEVTRRWEAWKLKK